MIRVEMRGDAEIVARLMAFPSALRAILRKRTYTLVLKLQARVQRKLSGEVLRVVTGALRRSIQSNVQETAETVRGRVFSTGDVKYARIHEYGGVIRHPGGTAYIPSKKEGMMMFISNTKATALMKRTGPHDIVMPERSFMRTSLAEMRDDIVRSLTEGVVEAAMAGRTS